VLEWYFPWSSVDWVLKSELLIWLAAIGWSYWIVWRTLIRKKPWLRWRKRP
jgi:hypothetical protein